MSAKNYSMKRACGSSDYWKETKSLAYLIQELFVIQTVGHVNVARQNQTLILVNYGTQSHSSNLLKTNMSSKQHVRGQVYGQICLI